jgi:RimJ/RimL family protein N-acetyltransferase
MEIGWRLRSDAQGKGYAKEAANACLYHAFETLNSLRVVSRTVKGNAPSWGLMKKLGMRPDPRLDYLSKDDLDEPLIVHVATYRDWKRIKKTHPDTRVVGL